MTESAHCITVAENHCEKVGHQLLVTPDAFGYRCGKCGLTLDEIRKPLSDFVKVTP